MINHTTAVEANVARHVAVLTVKIIFREPNPQIIVRTATPSSLGFIVNGIILQAINAKHIKLAETAMHNTW